MLYRSTRSDAKPIGAAQAILEGIAPDGGLYVPVELPRLGERALSETYLSYPELAFEVLSPFFPEFSTEELRRALDESASRFSRPEVVPLVRFGDTAFLELFHGPTCAFKDLALSLMGSLLGMARNARGAKEEILILVATSGDTGKAALEGLAPPGRSAKGVHVTVFYPAEGVSPVQRLQMTSHDSPGATVIGVKGNFDDAQRGVKTIFTSASARAHAAAAGMVFSSANSINIARLLPQIVYYVAAWRAMRDAGSLAEDGTLDVAVPTGNFGNILAAWYAKRMGLPIGRLICASNKNNVLTDFFSERTYDRNRPFYKTASPSMDILISSNLERLIFHATGGDPVRTARLMRDLAEKGSYTLTEAEAEMLKDFRAGWADEDKSAAALNRVFKSKGYLCDPHTAVAVAVLDQLREKEGSARPTVVTATASPFKFPLPVASAIGFDYGDPRAVETVEGQLALDERLASIAGLSVPEPITALRGAREVHTMVVEPKDMEASLGQFFAHRRVV
jgi:threonine synthase